jgi:hypothetical protein
MKRLLLLAALLALSPETASAQVKGPVTPYPPPAAQKPLPLPELGKYQPEKAAATDLVSEASQALVTRNAVAVKATPAPFVRLAVPDPFENRNLLRVVAPVPEEAAPPLVLPRK